MSSFEQVLALVEPADASIAESVTSFHRLSVDDDSLCVGDRRFQFTERSFDRLCGRLNLETNVPASYLWSLPADFRTKLMRLHLNEASKSKNPISLFSRGNELVGFGRPDLALLNGRDVLEAAVKGAGGEASDMEFTQSGLEDDALRFDLIVHRASHQVRRGDVVHAGVRLHHSLTGEFSTKVEGFMFRLVCLNGAVHRECTKPREVARTRRLPADHPKAKDQQRTQISRLVTDAIATLGRRFEVLDNLASERVEFDHFATHWLRRTRLSPQRLLPLLRDAHEVEGGEDSAYGVLNAFTRVATHHANLPLNTRNILARLGGMLAFGHSRMCPRCWSLIASSN